MSLCVVIGDDPVGRYMASQIAHGHVAASVIGLEGARPWLSSVIGSVEFVGVLEFGRFRSMLRDRNVKHLVFAGGVANSLRYPRFDRLALQYLKRQRGFWIPHCYLQALQDMLSDKGVGPIGLNCVVDICPELGLTSSLLADRHRGHDAARDVGAALGHVKGLSLRRLRQSHIVDGGRRLMSGIRSNDLLQHFGASNDRKLAIAPVLCKIAVPPFENIVPATIGSDTAKVAIANGVTVIVVQSGRTIVMQKDELADLAARNLLSVLVC